MQPHAGANRGGSSKQRHVEIVIRRWCTKSNTNEVSKGVRKKGGAMHMQMDGEKARGDGAGQVHVGKVRGP
jgi:hypothetical protein